LEEGGPALFMRALPKVAQARFINQLVKDTGIDRQYLCDMFLDTRDKPDAQEISRDVVLKVAKTFAVPVPV